MKVSLYIEKKDFDNFFIWANRLNQGVLSTCPVRYSQSREGFTSPLHLSLEAEEYALIRDSVSAMEDIREKLGGDFYFRLEPLENDKIVMQTIIKNAQRHDLEVDIVNTALEVSMQIPGITPLEALIIAEREWINVGNSHHIGDI